MPKYTVWDAVPTREEREEQCLATILAGLKKMQPGDIVTLERGDDDPHLWTIRIPVGNIMTREQIIAWLRSPAAEDFIRSHTEFDDWGFDGTDEVHYTAHDYSAAARALADLFEPACDTTSTLTAQRSEGGTL